jgi:hypothetical protein
MDLCYGSTQRSPPPFIHRQRDNFLPLRNEMSAEYGTHAHGVTGALELDYSVDPVGVGAGKRSEPTLGRRLGEDLRARGAEAEGEVGVNVEVDHSKKRERDKKSVSGERDCGHETLSP